ncbi:MAG: 1-acyl-sn-glycerol-3-phosphate acyltransferase, partial [Gemmatimonadetes bacterium]|nr:1-acyl-sn-glycerol-3-phosphate acyltransferase [Gemmatimonadota bacterium]
WLLPHMARIARAAARIYYRIRVEGEAPPQTGPVLFVANHPNSLIDPVLVAAAADRPLRFLAKAPLFEERLVGPLMRASGSIPVYRRQDDPELMDRNASVFEAVHSALAEGAAVGIFPEGLSHSEPSLVRLRTGAARIALGAADRAATVVPIVPVGIVLRQKDRFRSKALVLVGSPVEWADLSGRPEDDAEAVRELTHRIEDALRDVTVNLERIDDRAVIECAEAVYSAELGQDRNHQERVRRTRQATEGLHALRQQDPARAAKLVARVRGFANSLSVLGLSPRGLEASARPRAAVGWSTRNLVYFLVGAPIAFVGHVLFFIPYQLTEWFAGRPGVPHDVRSARKLLGGGLLYIGWCVLLALAVGWLTGILPGVAAAVTLPLVALITLAVRERWKDAREEVRRYFVLRRTGDVRGRLLERRRELAEELERLRREISGEG